MQLYKEGWLGGHSQHTFLNHRTLHVVILNDDIFLQNFDGVQFICTLPLSQHDLLEKGRKWTVLIQVHGLYDMIQVHGLYDMI